MTILRNTIFLLALMGMSSSSQAADLLEVYRDARLHDAAYAAARASRDAGQERVVQGRAGLLPVIGLSANTTRNQVESTPRAAGVGSNVDYNGNGWTVSLSQPLFRWQNWLTYRQGEQQTSLAEAQFVQASQELVLRVAQAYFDVLLAQENLSALLAQKHATAEQLAAARKSFEVGTVTITDTHEAQARYDLIIAQKIAADSELAVRQQVLRSLTGKEYPQLKGLQQALAFGRPTPDSMEAWVVQAERDSISVQLAESAQDIARLEQEKQVAGHYPTVDIVATHGASSTGYAITAPNGVDLRSTTIGVQVNLPLFSGGAISSKAREAAALLEKSRVDLENARRQSALAARQAYLAFSNGLAQIRAFEAGLASSQMALNANKLGYEVGIRINIDVLNAQSQLFDTRVKLVKARLDTVLSLLRLKQAAGILAENDLATINTFLN